ncbi:taste receptor type 2 member 40-like [Latimeria chalumnae]|uniref:taste receptor type 2 member 40-like n=1 Tax=Latimeria chalumnae TaxID=7897 RepID=UPI00313E3FD6
MSAADTVQLGVAVIIIGFGCLGNAFIILVFLLEYRRSRSLQTYEPVVTLMALCSLMAELIYLVKLVIYILNLCTYFGETIYKVTDFFTVFLPKSTIWLTAWLCFIYCMKIVKVNWRFFMRAKQRSNLAVKGMITLTAMLCFSLTFPIITHIKFSSNPTNICRQDYIVDQELSFLFASMLSLLTSLLPLVIMLVSSLGIVIFLCRHSRNIDRNVTPDGTPHSDAHTSVAIMLLCLIALFIACAGTAFCVNITLGSGQLDVVIVIALTNIIYSSGSPIILIIGTVKLRNSFAKLFCAKGWTLSFRQCGC